ncbi:MAG: hypothetical protein ACT4OS_00185 [Acidimicrobiales bacterium]
MGVVLAVGGCPVVVQAAGADVWEVAGEVVAGEKYVVGRGSRRRPPGRGPVGSKH